MPPLIILALVIGIPLLLAILTRVKPLYFFIAIVTGYFWTTFLGDSAELTLRSMVHINNPGVIIRLFLLLIPVVITLVLMRKALSTSSLPFQLVLLVADSLLLATFLVPLLTLGTQNSIYQTHAGNIFYQAHDVIIAGVAALHALVMWLLRPRHHDAHKHGKKHRR